MTDRLRVPPAACIRPLPADCRFPRCPGELRALLERCPSQNGVWSFHVAEFWRFLERLAQFEPGQLARRRADRRTRHGTARRTPLDACHSATSILGGIPRSEAFATLIADGERMRQVGIAHWVRQNRSPPRARVRLRRPARRLRSVRPTRTPRAGQLLHGPIRGGRPPPQRALLCDASGSGDCSGRRDGGRVCTSPSVRRLSYPCVLSLDGIRVVYRQRSLSPILAALCLLVSLVWSLKYPDSLSYSMGRETT